MRFAITGSGTISHRFAQAIARIPGSEVSAVLSRTQQRADAFAAEIGARRGYCDIDNMLEDANVDAVYIGVPNNLHLAQTLAALRHHKPVLCEKPMCCGQSDALTAIEAARECDTLLMEALWTRTMPAYRRAKDWIAQGCIGAPLAINAAFCFHTSYDPASRLYDPTLGGGALFDVGVYALGFALDMAGRAPDVVNGMLHLCPGGVDDYAAVQLRLGDVIASLNAGVNVTQPGDAYVYGERGCIYMPKFWGARRCELRDNSGALLDSFDDPIREDLYYEALHFIDCCERGLKQSPLIPLTDSLELARLYDELRAQAGLEPVSFG